MRNSSSYVAGFRIILWGLIQITSAYSATCRPKINLDMQIENAFEYNNNCAVVPQSVLIWTEARDFCRAGGGELLKLSSQNDVDRVSAILKESGNERKAQCYWIGLNDRQNNGDFRWLDETKTKFEDMFDKPSMIPYSDSRNCVTHCCCTIEGKPNWVEQRCLFPHQPLCEFEKLPPLEDTKAPTTHSSTETTVLTTPNSSTVTHSESTPTSKKKKPRNFKRTAVSQLYQYRVFTKAANLQGNPYLLAKPAKIMVMYSAIMCCSKCMQSEGCNMINFSRSRGMCRFYLSSVAVQQGVEDILDWAVFIPINQVVSPEE